MKVWFRLRLPSIYCLHYIIAIQAKEPELPLCPTNMQYFPQNLPMHCRMPVTLPPFPPQLYQNPLLGKPPETVPMPLPGIPGPIPAPISGPLPLPMVPMPQVPAQKLPVIVMPFYSPDKPSIKKPHSSHQGRPPRKHKTIKKRRPKHYYNSDEDSTNNDSDTDDSTDVSSERGWWKGPRVGRRSNRHHKSKRKKHQSKAILTPVLQYVTKDGYVIFEKQISKGEAKDWLVSKNEKNAAAEDATRRNENVPDSNEPVENPGTKFLVNNVEETEVKAETNQHQLHKIKKNMKRKSIRKHTDK